MHEIWSTSKFVPMCMLRMLYELSQGVGYNMYSTNNLNEHARDQSGHVPNNTPCTITTKFCAIAIIHAMCGADQVCTCSYTCNLVVLISKTPPACKKNINVLV